jgi:hypothetical protein
LLTSNSSAVSLSLHPRRLTGIDFSARNSRVFVGLFFPRLTISANIHSALEALRLNDLINFIKSAPKPVIRHTGRE